MKKASILIALFVLLTGCAPKIVDLESAPFVSDSNIISRELLESTEARNIPVNFGKDGGIYSGGKILLTIDGKKIAYILGGEKLTIYLSEGDYLFGVQLQPNPFNLNPLEEIDTNVSEGKANNYRIELVDVAAQRYKINRSSQL